MMHPLIYRLLADYGYTDVSLANIDEFSSQPGTNVLFFPGDPAVVRDATDVAVVIPELVTAFGDRLNAGVVTDVFGDGMELKRRYGFREYPSLVFLRDGKYVGTISRIQDWAVYLEQIAELLEAPTRRPPGFAIPVVTETTDEQREPLR